MLPRVGSDIGLAYGMLLLRGVVYIVYARVVRSGQARLFSVMQLSLMDATCVYPAATHARDP